MKRHNPRESGLSIVETLVTVAASATLLLVATITLVTLQRSYKSASNYAKAKADQRRSLDYIARDLRQATAVVVAPDKQSITLTIPDSYTSYDAFGYPAGPLRSPTIAGTTITYGDPAKPLTVVYKVLNAKLLRQQTWFAGVTPSTRTMIICSDVAGLKPEFTGIGSEMNVSIQLASSFIKLPNDTGGASSKMSESVSIRNSFLK